MKKCVLCILSVLALAATVFRVGCRVEVNGTVLPGIYAPEVARQSVGEARRAAEEICRADETAPFRLLPVLCARYTDGDGQALTRLLLEGYDGVSVLYAVYADGARVGTTDDPGLPGTIWDESMAARAMTGAGAAVPVIVRRVFTYPAAVTDVMELMDAMSEAIFY